MPAMKILLMSSDPRTRELMAVAAASAERALGESILFIEARDGLEAIKRTWRDRPDVVVTEESASRAGGFAVAKELRGAAQPFEGGIVILLDRALDWWLAKWSGADTWFTKPIDPFALADAVVGLARGRVAEAQSVAVPAARTKEGA
jgi:DNA-binding response OmpR family regulator